MRRKDHASGDMSERRQTIEVLTLFKKIMSDELKIEIDERCRVHKVNWSICDRPDLERYSLWQDGENLVWVAIEIKAEKVIIFNPKFNFCVEDVSDFTKNYKKIQNGCKW